MRGLIPLYLIAIAAYRAGKRMGHDTGQIDGFGKAAAVFTAGTLKGRDR